MKVIIYKDEYWPMYGVDSYTGAYKYGSVVDIPHEIVQEYLLVMKHFEEVQDKLKQYYGEE